MSDKAEQIKQRASELWGSAAPAYGGKAKLAREFGVTRQYIDMLLGKTERVERRVCACGERISYSAKECKACWSYNRWGLVSCSECGADVQVRPAELIWRTGRKNVVRGREIAYTGRRFCNRHCWAMFVGKQPKKRKAESDVA